MSASNTWFSAFSFITLILVCIPLPWHLQAWNTGTCLFMIWTALGLLVTFINSIIWRANAVNVAPVWCDIATKVSIGVTIAIPAASLCINRRLYTIVSVRSVTWTKAEKVRAVLIDLAIGVGIPILVMCFHYIVQGRRFAIMEEIGCHATVHLTWLALVLVYLPPFFLGLISASYSVRTIVQLRHCMKELNQILSSNSNLGASRFYRLMALASAEIFLGIPLHILIIVRNFLIIEPWISWDEDHFDFDVIQQIPAVIWKSYPFAYFLEINRWMIVLCGLIFFMFFGFADEAQKHYKFAFDSVAKRVGLPRDGSSKGQKWGSLTSSGISRFKLWNSTNKEPIIIDSVHSSKEIAQKRNSAVSFTSFGDTDVSSTTAPSRCSTLTKPPQLDELRFSADSSPPSLQSLCLPPAANFLDLSRRDSEIGPENINKV